MKIKTVMLVSLILFSWLAVFSQVKKTAVKFDEFFNFPSEQFYSVFYDRTGRFSERMEREPASSKAVIIFYNQRKGKYPLNGGSEWSNWARSSLNISREIPVERVVVIDGGYREFPTLEFWIVPEGAEMPKPTPAFSRVEVVYCPEINVAG